MKCQKNLSKLVKNITLEEMKATINSISKGKAIGPNGLPMDFFQ
jgi:hypothetical protein